MDIRNAVHFPLPDDVSRAMDLLTSNGYEAFVVGGAVRDFLRGVTPHDYDITTSATPDEMKRVFSAFRLIETGVSHGTLTVLIDGRPLEITTYRIDGSYSDLRHPDSVCFTRSLEEDVARRDFTINAMAYHPKEGLRDYFGGWEDLERAEIRTVGESRRRFTEDALRILRALRFSSVLGYSIVNDTALAAHELKDLLKHVAAERIREEFLKLLVGANAPEVLRSYADVIGVFLPEILPMIGFHQQSVHHDFDVWEHTLRALAACPPDPILRLAILFHDIGKPAVFSLDSEGNGHFYGHAEGSARLTDEILKRLRFDNQTRERTVLLVRMHDTVPTPQTRQFARFRSRYGDRFLSDWLTVVRADRTGKHECLSSSDEAALTEAEAAAKALLEKEERLCLSSLAIKGDDLLALGYRGPDIGNALHKALDALLSGRVKNEKEALIHMLEKEKNAPPIECERKFLIRRPDEALLRSMGAQASNITQTYLLAEPGVTERVRARVFSDKTVYTHTKKVRISALSATEDEKEVSHEDYERLLKRSDPSRTPLQKTRYTLPSGKHLLEMDLYPFWEKQAVLEIELSAEDEKFTIPDFIFVLREVTGEAAYKNVHLAKQVPAEEA